VSATSPEVNAGQYHVPTPTALSVFTCKIVCSCEWETAIHDEMSDAWAEYRGHYDRAVVTVEAVPPPPQAAEELAASIGTVV
jgi:hypothetical protein